MTQDYKARVRQIDLGDGWIRTTCDSQFIPWDFLLRLNEEYEYESKGVVYKAISHWDGKTNVVVTSVHESPKIKWKFVFRYYDDYVFNVSKTEFLIEVNNICLDWYTDQPREFDVRRDFRLD